MCMSESGLSQTVRNERLNVYELKQIVTVRKERVNVYEWKRTVTDSQE